LGEGQGAVQTGHGRIGGPGRLVYPPSLTDKNGHISQVQGCRIRTITILVTTVVGNLHRPRIAPGRAVVAVAGHFAQTIAIDVGLHPIYHPIAVVIDSISVDFGETGPNHGGEVVTIRRTCPTADRTVTIAVDEIDGPITVVVLFIAAYLYGIGIDRGVTIVTISADIEAIFVGIQDRWIEHPITIVVHAIAPLTGIGGHGRVPIVTVVIVHPMTRR
jgi:hypothetical protein